MRLRPGGSSRLALFARLATSQASRRFPRRSPRARASPARFVFRPWSVANRDCPDAAQPCSEWFLAEGKCSGASGSTPAAPLSEAGTPASNTTAPRRHQRSVETVLGRPCRRESFVGRSAFRLPAILGRPTRHFREPSPSDRRTSNWTAWRPRRDQKPRAFAPGPNEPKGR